MNETDDKKRAVSNFAKYSAISFQMLVTIGLFAFAGFKIDQHRNAKTPVFTAILSILGVVLSLYQVVRQLNKNEH